MSSETSVTNKGTFVSIVNPLFYVKKNNDRLSQACVHVLPGVKYSSLATTKRLTRDLRCDIAVHAVSVRGNGNQLLGGLPWPMSDEFVNNNNSIYDRRLSDHRIDDGAAELDAANELGDELAPQHHRAPARRIGELLVEAYGKAVPKKGRKPVPSIVLLESAQFLVRGVEFRYSIICRFFSDPT
jgi:hypothetical protein